MRIEGDFIKINEWLRPLSWLYGLGVGFRNMLFEIGVLKSRAYDIPVIAVGNITVGGSGKTPHVESRQSAARQAQGGCAKQRLQAQEPWLCVGR